MITIAIFIVLVGVWHHHVPGAFAFLNALSMILESGFVAFLFWCDQKARNR